MERFSDEEVDVDVDAVEEMDELEEAEELEGDEDDGDARKDRRSKDRSRQLEFDERQGRVVARKRRKENRQPQSWETEDWEEEV